MSSNPYPGLRSFRVDEDHLFFGREKQVRNLIDRLDRSRFLAVVGTSGSGKSSLVRCGLLSELQRGTLVEAGSHWEVAVMQPGGDPARRLAEALIDADLYDPEDEEVLPRLLATLSRSRHGLTEAVNQSEMEPGGNLLIVVDQFEELFRFRQTSRQSADAAAGFVRLLLEAVRQDAQRIYVVLTMRSDFLGDCAQFNGLAEAVNDGEYLIPRLNRDQTQLAIEGPARVGGGALSRRLVQRLLLDVEDDADRLPIMQHCLMRLWEAWEQDHHDGEPMDLRHYEATGGMALALSQHADEVLVSLPSDTDRAVAERVFKALTESGEEGRRIRRPQRFHDLVAIGGGDGEAVAHVVDAYRSSGVTLLMPPEGSALEDTTVIDISHESLMRVWERLRHWVDEEEQSAGIYRRLVETARLWEAGKAGLYQEPELPIAHAWREEVQPNVAWAELYGGGYETAMAFLEESDRAAHRLEAEREAARQRELEQAQALAQSQKRTATVFKRFAGVVGVLCLIALGLAHRAWNDSKRAKVAEVAAKNGEMAALEARKLANHLNGKNWLANAQALAEEGDSFGAQLKAARAVGFAGWGRRKLTESEKERFPVLLDREEETDWVSAQQTVSRHAQTTLLWQHGALPQHSHDVRGVAVTPDGRLVVTAGREEREIWIWDGRNGELRQRIPSVLVRGVRRLALSRDGNTLAYSGGGELAFLQRGADDQFISRSKTVAIENDEIDALAFSQDGDTLAIATGNNYLYLWKGWESFREETFPEKAWKFPGSEGTSRMEFGPPESNKLAVSGDSPSVLLVDLSGSEPVLEATLQPSEWAEGAGGVWSLAFSPDGHSLVVAGHGFPVTVWNVVERTVDRVLLQDAFDRLARDASGRLRGKPEPTFTGSEVAFLEGGKILGVGWSRFSWRFHGGYGDAPVLSLFHRGEGASGGWEASAWERRDVPLEIGRIWYMHFGADDRHAVVGCNTGAVQLWDWKEGRLAGPPAVGHTTAVEALAFGRDGLRFASGDERGIICLWDARTGQPQRRFRGHEGRVADLCFSADGRFLYSIGESDGAFKVWDADTGDQRLTVRGSTALNSLDLSPDGRWIAVVGDAPEISLYDASDLTKRQALQGARRGDRLRFLSSGLSLVVIDAENRSASVFEKQAGTGDWSLAFQSEFPISQLEVPLLATLPRAPGFVVSLGGGRLGSWRRSSSGAWEEWPTWARSGFQESLRGLEFDPTGRRLATGGADDIQLWNQKGEREAILRMEDEVSCFTFSPDGTLLLTGGRLGFLQLWSVAGGPVLRDTPPELSEVGVRSGGRIRGVNQVPLSLQRDLFFTCGSGDEPQAIHAWHVNQGEPSQAFVLRGHRTPVGCLALSADERYLASSSVQGDGQLIFWDLETRQPIRTVGELDGIIWRMAFSPDGRTLAYTLMDSGQSDLGGSVHLRDVASGEQLGDAVPTKARAIDARFTLDGRELLVSDGPRLSVWRVDPETRACSLAREVRIEHSRSAQNPRFRIHQIGITPDGQTLVITSNQNEVYVRDLQTLEPVGAPIEGTDYSGGVEFSRDGSLVAIGGFGTISIYRLDRPERALAVFEVPGDVNDNRSAVVVDLEFSEDDRFLIVGSTYSASVFELPIHWGDPDPAAYLDVVQLEEASGALEWNLANRSLFPPADPRMFVPLHEVYLPTLKGATSSQELAGALFDHYLSRGFLQAAQGVLLSMEEEASEEMWTQWREASSRAAED